MIHHAEERQKPSLLSAMRLPMAAAILLWFAQPPFSFWPLATVALLPLIVLVHRAEPLRRSDWIAIWIAGTAFWLASLQGLRHAHSLMFLGWFALSGYLALYWIVFIYSARWFHHGRSLSIGISVSIAWIGQEFLRNYLLTGLSACMLGHSMAEVPVVMQIAACFGSYGVSLFVICLNILLYDLSRSLSRSGVDPFSAILRGAMFGNRSETGSKLIEKDREGPRTSTEGNTIDRITSIGWVSAVLLFGVWRFEFTAQSAGDSSGSFLLIQRSEAVEYTQPTSRAVEIYQAYAQQTLRVLSEQMEPVDAVIWPESMYSAGNPWMETHLESNAEPAGGGSALSASAEAVGLTPADLLTAVNESQAYFEQRSMMLYQASLAASVTKSPIDFLVGCGVMRYAEKPEVYCGLVQFGSGGRVKQWYGKNHLVMFGEYIPLISSLPWVKTLIPPGMGLNQGSNPEPMRVGQANVLPNICIETAVERVALNHLRSLNREAKDVDVIVTITNDSWFDQSSIIEHHLRCAQFVAVATGRPILSAANNGPTAWIDAQGRVVDRVDQGTNGTVVASPQRPSGSTLYARWGAWPIVPFGLATCWPLLLALKTGVRRKKD